MNITSAMRHAALLALFLVSAGSWANSYEIVDLGQGRLPVGINNDGTVAATFHDRGWKALVRRGGHWHLLLRRAIAYGVDVDGTVGGGTIFVNGVQTPYTWDPRGIGHVLTLPQASVNGGVRALSHGQVTGVYSLDDQFAGCFIGDAATGATTDMGGSGCQPAGMNASGHVVGSFNDGEAFIWQDGVFTDLGSLGDGGGSSALAVNDAAHVVGLSSARSFPHAFLWKDGAMTDIGISSKFFSTAATSINNQDLIVGWGQPLRGGQYRACRFEAGSVISLDEESINRKGWKLEKATGINDAGVIVGYGKYRGRVHGFMLLPR